MKSPREKAGRVVRRKLADGTTKTYRYAAYHRKPTATATSDSISALLTAYQRSPEWNRLAAVTRTNYTIYLRELSRVDVAHVRVQDVRRKDILTLRDAIAAARGNGAATGFIRAASALFSWAVDREWIDASPVNRIKPIESGHLKAWSRQQADHAVAHLPEHLRRVVILARYTGARRGDLCRLTWAAYDDSTIRYTPRKTARRRTSIELCIPVHPVLKAELDSWKARATTLTILTGPKGKPWVPTLLSHYLPTALAKIGLPDDLNVHGLRKLCAAELADCGCSTHEIAAITGHSSLSMVELYTRSADQKRLAEAAVIRLSERLQTNKQ